MLQCDYRQGMSQPYRRATIGVNDFSHTEMTVKIMGCPVRQETHCTNPFMEVRSLYGMVFVLEI